MARKKNNEVGSDAQELHFVANMLLVEQGGKLSRAIEYEVITDAQVTGNCKFGPYSLSLWEVGIIRPGENRRLCLRVEEAIPPDDSLASAGADAIALYHGGGIADEIAAVVSVAPRCRCTLGSITRLDNQPLILPTKYVKWIDRQAVQGTKDLSTVPQWLKLAANLPAKSRARFLLSAKLY